jgi:hypothetical protein
LFAFSQVSERNRDFSPTNQCSILTRCASREME